MSVISRPWQGRTHRNQGVSIIPILARRGVWRAGRQACYCWPGWHACPCNFVFCGWQFIFQDVLMLNDFHLAVVKRESGRFGQHVTWDCTKTTAAQRKKRLAPRPCTGR